MDPADSAELRDLSQLLEKLSTSERPAPNDAERWKERCLMAEAALGRTRELQRMIEEELEADLESVEALDDPIEEVERRDNDFSPKRTDFGHPVELMSSNGLHAPGEMLLGQGCIHVAHLLGTVDPENLVGLRMLDESQPNVTGMEDSAMMTAPPPQCVARNSLGKFEEEEFDSFIAQSPTYDGNETEWIDVSKEKHTWEIIWKGKGELEALHRIKFQCSRDISDLLQNHISNWKANETDHSMTRPSNKKVAVRSAKEFLDTGSEQGSISNESGNLESLYDDLVKERHMHTYHRHRDKKLYSRQSVSRMLGVVYAKMLIRRQEKMLRRKTDSQSQSSQRSKFSQNSGESSTSKSNAKLPTVSEGIKLLPGKYLPSLNRDSAMLTETHLRCLAAQLPTRYRLSDWTLLYSSVKHGISLQTLYRKAAGKHPSVLVMRDRKGYLFGCFVTEGWKAASKYFGTGETFVFQLEPSQKAYTWSHKNNYFLFCTQESLAVGGGGHFAIWIDSDFCWGNSGNCETFDSPCLASSEDFHCVHVEVWGIR